jgi:hypothetical protein
MPRVTLDAADAAELTEILQFLSDWMAGDPGCLGRSLQDFTGNRAYGTAQLRQDLNRFAFLLGGHHGGPVFGP